MPGFRATFDSRFWHGVSGNSEVPDHQNKLQITIDIIGMTCTGCARTLENAFRKFDGIEYSVNFPEGNIVVTYSSSAYQRRDFEEAIEAHGYRVEKE